MKRVLVTGFEPFGGEHVNPAFEAVKLLPARIAGAEVIRLEIPTSYVRSIQAVETAIEEWNPDVILNVGQAGGRSCVTLERTAVNLAEARMPDNDGMLLTNCPLREDGEAAYFATIPVMAAMAAVREAGLPCHISYTAGTYVCNAVMYHVLYLCARKYPAIKAGFVHVPYAPEQAVNKPNGTPSMSLADIARSLEAIIAAAVTVKEDLPCDSGQTH